MSIQTLVNSKPEGEKERVLESNEAKDVAVWLSQRRGQLVSLPENQVISG